MQSIRWVRVPGQLDGNFIPVRESKLPLQALSMPAVITFALVVISLNEQQTKMGNVRLTRLSSDLGWDVCDTALSRYWNIHMQIIVASLDRHELVQSSCEFLAGHHLCQYCKPEDSNFPKARMCVRHARSGIRERKPPGPMLLIAGKLPITM